MNQPFLTKLIYKDWLIKEFVLINDIINLLRIESFIIGKIRECSAPPLSYLDCNDDYITYNDVIFEMVKFAFLSRSCCLINENEKCIYYCYKNKLYYNGKHYYFKVFKVLLDNVDHFDIKHNYRFQKNKNDYEYDLDTKITLY